MEIRAIHLPDLAFDPSFGVDIFKYNFEKKSFVAINDPGKEYSLNYIVGNKDFNGFKQSKYNSKNDYLEMYKNFDKMLIMDQIWKVFKL